MCAAVVQYFFKSNSVVNFLTFTRRRRMSNNTNILPFMKKRILQKWS